MVEFILVSAQKFAVEKLLVSKIIIKINYLILLGLAQIQFFNLKL